MWFLESRRYKFVTVVGPMTNDKQEDELVRIDGRVCPLPTRRQIREVRGREDTQRVAASHRASRVSLVAALAAVTVAIPVSGFVGPSSTVALPQRALGTPQGGQSWVAGITTSTQRASALDGTVTAASRTRVRTPLTSTGCAADETAANGSRTVVETAELDWPLTKGSYEVTSSFGSRVSPITGQVLVHEGVDMSASLGTPIHAVSEGTVVEVSSDYRSGTYVRIQHTAADGTTYFSAYAHEYMQDILVKQGDHVSAGQQIGAVGSNGWSTGPHLHFEIRDAQNTAVDPLEWMESHGAAFVGEACS